MSEQQQQLSTPTPVALWSRRLRKERWRKMRYLLFYFDPASNPGKGRDALGAATATVYSEYLQGLRYNVWFEEVWLKEQEESKWQKAKKRKLRKSERLKCIRQGRIKRKQRG